MENFHDFEIGISFPGYKSRIGCDGAVIFDYRIDLLKPNFITSLSHVNILIDLFVKATSSPNLAITLLEAIQQFSAIPLVEEHAYNALLCLEDVNMNSQLLHDCNVTHLALKKVFNRKGNEEALSMSALFNSLKWIVIQEDINYPISKGYLGRGMCFARYAEAIYTAQHAPEQIQEVVRRALSHNRPTPWSEVDYSFLQNIS